MEQSRKMQWKIVGLFCALLGIASLLMVRLYSLSMDEGLKQAAQMQRVYTLDITTTRGRIYDRNINP